MKRIYLLFALLALIALSCSKDEEENSFNYDLNTLYGTWQVGVIEFDDGSTYDLSKELYISKYGETTATFRSDKSYSGKGFFGNGSGTYEAKDKTITCYVSGSVFAQYEVLSLAGQKASLKMTIPDEEGYILLTCTKK